METTLKLKFTIALPGFRFGHLSLWNRLLAVYSHNPERGVF